MYEPDGRTDVFMTRPDIGYETLLEIAKLDLQDVYLTRTEGSEAVCVWSNAGRECVISVSMDVGFYKLYRFEWEIPTREKAPKPWDQRIVPARGRASPTAAPQQSRPPLNGKRRAHI